MTVVQDMRESPDGAYSYVIDGPCPMSSMSNISDLKLDLEEETCSSEGPERDILMEFVMMEERQEERRKGPSPFKGYAEKVKSKVIREYVGVAERERRWRREERGRAEGAGRGESRGEARREGREEGGRPPTRALAVRKQGRRLLKSRSQSLSMDQLQREERSLERKEKAARLVASRHTYYSTERLPTLSREEEERIIRLKKYEDDTEMKNEKREIQQRGAERQKLRRQHSLQNGHITIYETDRPKTVPEEYRNDEEVEGEVQGQCQSAEPGLEQELEGSSSTFSSQEDEAGRKFRRKLR